MSHAVLRGKPTAAHLYLDGILNEVLVSRGEIPDAEGRGRLNLPQILFYCLDKNPENVFMINGATGDKITNAQILKQAIPLARKLASEGLRGKMAVVAMHTDQTMAAVYLALLFAGVVPFFLFPSNTVYEIHHFLKLIEPSIVFCSKSYYSNMKTALESLPELKPDILLPDTLPEPLSSLDASKFLISDACVDDTLLLVPTSGSTGLPKACVLTHRGFVAKLSEAWCRSTEFPTPTGLVFLVYPPSGVLFHRMLSSCITFSLPVLLPYDCRSEEWVKTALLTYRPTWAQFAPYFAKFLVFCTTGDNLSSPQIPMMSSSHPRTAGYKIGITADHLSSLQCLMLSGTDPCKQTTAALMQLLPKSAVLEVAYGLTESHSVVATGENGEPLRMCNVFEYKLIDEDGNTLGLRATGELCLKGPALAKGYYRNNANFLVNGWFNTGDRFYIDEEERLFYRGRKSTCFKFMYSYVSPEEVEGVISSIPGVLACVVCSTERGAAAAVVARAVPREHVHRAVNDAMSLYKRLHGGVGFVPALPLLSSGKLDRLKCDKLVQQLIASGDCY